MVRRLSRSRLTFHGALLILTVTVLGAMASGPARQVMAQRKEIVEQERKLEVLSEENAKLKQRIDRLNDPDYMEKLAREQLGLVRDGEIAYVVVPSSTVTDTVKPKGAPDPAWYERAWKWIKDLL